MFTTAATVLAFAAAIATATDSTSDCAVQPAGLGPIPTPNTDTAFAASTVFASLANNAVTPPLYSRVFVNLNASESATSTNVYLGYYELASYDPASCTALCDKTSGCVATNLYFERDPTLNPADSCPNPPATTAIKCALWGSPITAAAAANYGQYRASFHVVISGSNGYMKLPSQACAAISSAWSGNTYSMPTGAVNWQAWTSSFGSMSGKFTTTSAWPSQATAGRAAYRSW